MALENDIQELTAAVKALTAALSNQVVEKQPEVKAEAKKSPEKDASTATAQDTSTRTKTLESEATAAAPPSESVDPEVTLQQLVAKFTDLVDFNRGAAVALLKEYGLPKLGQAKPEQYVEIFNKTCELLNG